MNIHAPQLSTPLGGATAGNMVTGCNGMLLF